MKTSILLSFGFCFNCCSLAHAQVSMHSFGNNTADLGLQAVMMHDATVTIWPYPYSNTDQTLWFNVDYTSSGELDEKEDLVYSNYGGIKYTLFQNETMAYFRGFTVYAASGISVPGYLGYPTNKVNGYVVGGYPYISEDLYYSSTKTVRPTKWNYVQFEHFQGGSYHNDGVYEFYTLNNVVGGYVKYAKVGTAVLDFGDNGTLTTGSGDVIFEHFQNRAAEGGITIPLPSAKGFVTSATLSSSGSMQNLPFKSGLNVACALGSKVEIWLIATSPALNPDRYGWLRKFTLGSTTILPTAAGGTGLKTFYAGDVINVTQPPATGDTSTPDRYVDYSVPPR